MARFTPPNRPREPIEEKWPPNVWYLGVDRLDLLGFDEDGQLYWDGEPVEIKKRLSLTFWEKVGAVLITISAVAGAIAAGVSAYADMTKP